MGPCVYLPLTATNLCIKNSLECGSGASVKAAFPSGAWEREPGENLGTRKVTRYFVSVHVSRSQAPLGNACSRSSASVVDRAMVNVELLMRRYQWAMPYFSFNSSYHFCITKNAFFFWPLSETSPLRLKSSCIPGSWRRGERKSFNIQGVVPAYPGMRFNMLTLRSYMSS